MATRAKREDYLVELTKAAMPHAAVLAGCYGKPTDKLKARIELVSAIAVEIAETQMKIMLDDKSIVLSEKP